MRLGESAVSVALRSTSDKRRLCTGLTDAAQVRNQVQRGIIVGAKGEVVGSIGLQARKELERLWGVPVHLVINVVVD